MDGNIGMEDVGTAVLQELWNRVTLQAMVFVGETSDMVFEKGFFQEFSKSISELRVLLQALNVEKVEAAMSVRPTKTALETLDSQLKRACKIIKDYKSRSSLSVLLQSRSVLSQMKALAEEIAKTISSWQLVNLNISVNLKSKTEQIINSLSSMEFHSAVATESLATEIEKLINENGRNRQNAIKLLQKIGEAVGVSSNASLVQNELALLKKEKEEMEAQKKQAEAFQLSQLMQFLYSTEIVMSPQDEEIAAYHHQYPTESFRCPLCKEMMSDPVAIVCGHSFERKAIQEHFWRGEKTCPICRERLRSTELTPNLSLRSSIEEWKQRDMDLKFQAALPGITSNDHSIQNRALKEMQVLMERPRYTEKVAEEGLISKFVEMLKNNQPNRIAALKCLFYLAKYCDNHKEAIIEAGAVRCIVRQFYKGEAEPDAVAVLLELSAREALAEKIGNIRDCIPVLVSLLNYSNPDVSQKAHKVLQNLSYNTHFVVKMAEAGYFQQFVARFNQGPHETRASMAAALIQMELKGNSIRELEDKTFIHNLVQMLSSSSRACISAGLKLIKKLVAFPRMVKRLLADPATVPPLLGLISIVKTDPCWNQEAAAILALLVEGSQFTEHQMYQGLQELQSQHNINLFLQLIASSDPQTKVQLLHLLVVLGNKFEMARNLIRTDNEAISYLFSSLEGDQPEVKLWAMKLVYCISEGHPAGVPLPPSPAKETAIKTLANILSNSPNIEERSTAAGIISQLPNDDIIIDEILCKSEVLKAIHGVICNLDEESDGTRAPDNSDASLLENALAALLRYTEPTKPQLYRQVGKLELYPLLVRILSRGSSLAKQRTATALAHLSRSTSLSISDSTITRQQAFPLLNVMKFFSGMSCCSSEMAECVNLCRVHGAACSSRDTFCLVKVDALKPLVQNLSEKESGVAEAALMALETLLTDHSTLPHATAAIVDSQGVVAILQVLEKGDLPAKIRALDLFQKILEHTRMNGPLAERAERILVQLLQDDDLRKKVALVLKQMGILPEQSSYF